MGDLSSSSSHWTRCLEGTIKVDAVFVFLVVLACLAWLQKKSITPTNNCHPIPFVFLSVVVI